MQRVTYDLRKTVITICDGQYIMLLVMIITYCVDKPYLCRCCFYCYNEWIL